MGAIPIFYEGKKIYYTHTNKTKILWGHHNLLREFVIGKRACRSK